MLTKSESLISDVTKNIISKVQTQINSLEYANNKKGIYSSQRILGVLQQIAGQISSSPMIAQQISAPVVNNNLKIDSHMSVFNVEVRQINVRHRSLTKNYRRRTINSSGEQMNKLLIKKRPTPYNKIKLLNEEDLLKVKHKQFQQQKLQEIEDSFRSQIEKKNKIMEEKIKSKIKFLTPIQKKQKFSYDYQYQMIKVKNQPIPNLVRKDRTLVGQLSKKIEKQDLPHKAKKPQTCQTEVSKVVQRVRKNVQKKRKNKEQQQQKPPEESITVQFSDIKSLTDQFQCQQGVKFIFEGGILKKRAKNNLRKSNIQKINHSNSSKLIVSEQNQKSYSNINNYQQESQKNNCQQRIINSERAKSLLNNSIFNRQKKSKSSISVANQTLLQTFLAPQLEKLMIKTQKTDDNNLSVSERTIKSVSNLNKIDEHNIMYIKKALKSQKTTLSSRQLLNAIYPHHNIVKVPYIRIRQKLQNRNSTIYEMKKRFQNSLRQTQK